MSIGVTTLKPGRLHLYGATQAQADMTSVLAELSGKHDGVIHFVLNLDSVESISGSYIRGTALWALLCGQAHAKQTALESLNDPWALRPIPLYPLITGCSKAVAEDIQDFFAQRNLPILLVENPSNIESKAVILGKLDSVLVSTLRLLATLGQATAAQLAEKSAEIITVNGWSNRLADLFLFRLVTRQRSGKYWIYTPLSRSFTLWD